MKKSKRIVLRLFVVLLIFVSFIYLNNTSLFTKQKDTTPILLAHRGMAQTFSMEGFYM